jgi:tetratricopeptide (TPR) repeat protein
MRSRSLVVAVCLAWIALVGYPCSSSAQSSASICDLPQYRGTAIYNKYCVSHVPPRSQTQAAPAPPPGQAEARDLNQKGIDAYNSGDDESAAKYFQEALDKAPDDSAIQQNLQNAKDQIAFKKQKSEEEFNQDKQKALGQLKGISNGGDFDSPSSLKGVGSTDSGLKDAPNSGDSMGLKTLPDVNLDAHVVDARHVPSGLPKAVDDAIASGYSGAPSGVSDRVRKGFQAVTTHDWKLAKAWFGDALNHDPDNAGLKRLVELADYTEKRIQQAKASKSTDPSSPRTAMQLPKGSESLFPGLPAIEARELNDYILDQAIKMTEKDPVLMKSSNRPAYNHSKLSGKQK